MDQFHSYENTTLWALEVKIFTVRKRCDVNTQKWFKIQCFHATSLTWTNWNRCSRQTESIPAVTWLGGGARDCRGASGRTETRGHTLTFPDCSHSTTQSIWTEPKCVTLLYRAWNHQHGYSCCTAAAQLQHSCNTAATHLTCSCNTANTQIPCS